MEPRFDTVCVCYLYVCYNIYMCYICVYVHGLLYVCMYNKVRKCIMKEKEGMGHGVMELM